MKGKKAIEGALKRAKDRPGNGLPMEAWQARKKPVANWKDSWSDWNDSSDFPNWQDGL